MSSGANAFHQQMRFLDKTNSNTAPTTARPSPSQRIEGSAFQGTLRCASARAADAPMNTGRATNRIVLMWRVVAMVSLIASTRAPLFPSTSLYSAVNVDSGTAISGPSLGRSTTCEIAPEGVSAAAGAGLRALERPLLYSRPCTGDSSSLLLSPSPLATPRHPRPKDLPRLAIREEVTPF